MQLQPYMPGPEEQVLLRALLLESPADAQAAAVAWLDGHDPLTANEGIRRLMPLLFHRMETWCLAHPARPRLAALYRHYWLMDQQMRRQLADVMDLVRPAGGPVVLLKGLSLGITVYPVPCTRATGDMDLMLPADVFARAADRLRAAGYPEKLGNFNAILFQRPGGPEVDLHTSPYHEAFSPANVAPLFARVVPLAKGPEGAFRLGDADQLLHTIVHGLRPDVVSPLRWMVDATLLVRGAGAGFDWPTFRTEMERLDLREVAQRGLEEMQAVLGGTLALPALAPNMRAASDAALAARLVGGPLAVWRSTRRNAGFFGRLALVADLYRRRIRQDGLLHLARRAVFWAGQYLFRRDR